MPPNSGFVVRLNECDLSSSCGQGEATGLRISCRQPGMASNAAVRAGVGD